jgi:hypothetical protein
MTQLVQSACPGCQRLLRIPAEWLPQPMRCKHCGMVMQAKPYASAARVVPTPTAAPAHRTPIPPTRKGQVTTPVARPVAPPAGIAAAAPMAIPVAQAANGSPFADLEPSEDDAAPRSRRCRKSGGWWKGPVLAFAVFVLAGIVAYLNWDRIKGLLPPDDEPVAQIDKSKEPVAAPPAVKDGGKKPPTTAPGTPAKDKPKPKPNDSPPKKDAPRKEPPKNPPRTDPPKTNPPPKDPSKPTPPRTVNNPFPRRALVISVHDYLYANPIQNGPSRPPDATNFFTLIESLNRGLNIPLNQVAHLSDDANHKWGARAPTKPVIEKTVTNFLDSARAQDRIMVFFVGHSVEMEDGVYLAPIEGELEKADTLIPLKWFYEQLGKCKARQKVLVLDVNRFNQTFGQERPGGEELGPKLDAMLKEPPAGVQVWASCSLKQRSYASDEYPMGVFLDSMRKAMKTAGNGYLDGPEKPIALERFVEKINGLMKEELSKRKLEQVSRLSGKEAESTLNYDKNESPAPDAVASLASAPADVAVNQALLESLFDQVGAPPVKVTHEMALRYDALPPFSVEALQKYQGDKPNPDSPLRKAVKNARAALWAIYPGEAPEKLNKEVTQLRGKIRVQLNVLKDGYRAPGGGNAEKQFKDMVENDERRVALIMRAIDDALEELQSKEVVEAREGESKRWKANYDFILARIELEYAYLFEYQSMLGSMRKEFPPRDAALHGGWKLASQPNLQGDSKGKKFAKEAKKLLDKIAKDNAGTPWEVLAKREKLTNLGLEWQPAK